MKIYINTPSNYLAGGVESLFQLGSTINNNGGTALLFDSIHGHNIIPKKYSHYNVKFTNIIEDSHENWVIYPEVWTEKIDTFTKTKNAIWWLSVDNNHNKFNRFKDSNIIHFYQSYYALNHLQKKDVYYYLPLFDFIQNEYIDTNYNIYDKKNIVCYNPAKGKHITDKIMFLNPDITFIPIINMNEYQVIETLKSSKMYIDFGSHCGRDRIPREACALGNCVITNKNGSARFFNDVCINEEYKFEDTNIDLVGKKIRNIFDNFEKHFNNFSLYRNIIKNQKEEHNVLIKQYFIKQR